MQAVDTKPHAERRVRAATSDDIPAVAGVVARAFCNNPGMAEVFRGTRESRTLALERVGLVVAQSMQKKATIELAEVGGRIVGAALSYAPGAYPPSIATELRMGIAILREGFGVFGRYLKADAWMRDVHPKPKHYYLFLIGVEPSEQGHGHGGALLRTLIARADADQLPIHLETDTEDNVRLYQRFGFEITRDDRLAGLRDLRLFTMLRPAGSK